MINPLAEFLIVEPYVSSKMVNNVKYSSASHAYSCMLIGDYGEKNLPIDKCELLMYIFLELFPNKYDYPQI